MIKKEENQRKKSKFKRNDSYRKKSSSSSSSSKDSHKRKKSIKKEKLISNEANTNFDMNYYKAQYENYFKNAASFLSSQNIPYYNQVPNINNNTLAHPHGMNPLMNNVFPNQFANFHPQNYAHYNPENNKLQNNIASLNIMPNMFPMLNPYMHMVPFNHGFPQPFIPVPVEMSDEQKKNIERININNYNFSKIISIYFHSKKFEFRSKSKESV